MSGHSKGANIKSQSPCVSTVGTISKTPLAQFERNQIHKNP